jgi:hypothetical protein
MQSLITGQSTLATAIFKLMACKQPVAQRQGNRFSLILDAKFGVQISQVPFDGAWRNHEDVGNFGNAGTFYQLHQDGKLLRSQVGRKQ